MLLMSPIAAEAAKVSLEGRVELITGRAPVGDARVTVTFYGHENGIHEYTTERRVRVRTDELGEFVAAVKVPDDRYIWTHAVVEIEETTMSKETTARSVCQIDDNGGCRCDRKFLVNPLADQ